MKQEEKAPPPGVRALLSHARHLLRAHVRGEDLPAEPAGLGREAEMGAERIHVSLRHGGRLRGAGESTIGDPGRDTVTALRTALTEALARPRLGSGEGPPLSAGEEPDLVVEVWIQLSSREVPRPVLANLQDLERGVHGLELRREGAIASMVPSVPILWRMRKHRDKLRYLSRKAGFPRSGWRNAASTVYRTTWRHFVEGRQAGMVELMRLRRRHPEPMTREGLIRRAAAATERLLASQLPDGSMTYLYDPLRGEVGDEPLNLVRMAGTTYSLTWASEVLDLGDRLESVTDKAIGYLQERLSPLPGWDGARFVAQEPGAAYGSLGATALTCLALQFGPFRQRYRDERRALVEGLVRLQNPDGSFQCRIDRPNSESTNHDYYPGEALLALCREAAHGERPELQAVIARSFDFHRRHFRTLPSRSFLLWQVDAWRLLHEILERRGGDGSGQGACRRYADFVFEQVDWLLPFQWTPEAPPHEDYVGGFTVPHRPACGSAAFLEAVIRACGLAYTLGEEERWRRYRQAALRGLEFLCRLQLGPEQAHYFPEPDLALGGVTASLSAFQLRCDRDQHVITAFLAAAETPGLLDQPSF